LLKNEGYVDNYANMAVDGFTTTMLLEFLHGLDNDDLRIIRNARIITLNIGGNNFLQPFLSYLSSPRVASSASIIREGAGDILSGAWGVVSGVRNIMPDSGFSTSGIADALSGAGDILAGTRSIIIGSEEIISRYLNLFSTFTGSFSPELRAEMNKAIQIFSDEFDEIIAWLRTNAPKATIIANTVYNPFPQEILRASLEISNVSNALVESMNSVIVGKSESSKILVTDIHTYLSNQLSLMKFNLNPLAGSLSFDIIHPNAEGHNLIAQLNFATFMRQ